MKTVVLICGYGCHLTENLQRYLNNISSYVNSESPFLVITSGGFTNEETAKGVSEAGLMKDHLIKNGFKPDLIKKEERATTTTGNLIFSKEIIDKLQLKDVRVVIWCDSIRSFKINYEAKRIFNNPEVKGFNFNRSWKEKLIQWCIATPLEILSFHFKSILSFKRKLREIINRNR